jgi:glycosyltransferase involved in cell wall biosynthesis
MPGISVIICAHNPRPEFLAQTLDALKAQTLPREQWELLLVDNASAKPLAGEWDLTWHPRGKHIREDELGLTPARLRGIRESGGDVLVFVDDDNLLAADYLQRVREISDAWPALGAWGGRIEGRFETPPPDWARPHLGMLAIREFTGDHWSNAYDRGETHPCGAGIVVRRNIADAYAKNVRSDPARLGLGRRGSVLTSCEDTDMALTAMDLGLGTGVFERLKLTHLIPAGRLAEDYLVNLTESLAFSSMMLFNLRGRVPRQPVLARRIYDWLRLVTMNSRNRHFELARRRGLAKARDLLQQAK